MEFTSFLVILTFCYVQRKWSRCVAPSVCPNQHGILPEKQNNNHNYVFSLCILATDTCDCTHTYTNWADSVLIWCSKHRKQNCCNMKRDFLVMFLVSSLFLVLNNRIAFSFCHSWCLMSLAPSNHCLFFVIEKMSLAKMFSFSFMCLLPYVSIIACLATLR